MEVGKEFDSLLPGGSQRASRVGVVDENSSPNLKITDIQSLVARASRERTRIPGKSKSWDHRFAKRMNNDPSLLQESRTKSAVYQRRGKLDEETNKLLQEKEQTIQQLKMELQALQESTKGPSENKTTRAAVSLERENKMLREENQFLKEDLQRLSLDSVRNMELVGKINQLEESLKDVTVRQVQEFVTITGMHEIIDGFLWLGDRFAAADTSVLKKLGITYLLTLYGTHEHEYSEPVKALCIPLCDFGSTDLGSVLKRCFAFIDEAKEKKQKILVHCAAGVNRSPSIVIAYLMRTNRWKYKEALNFVLDKRWFINPAPLYRKQLQQYEDILFGERQRPLEEVKSESKPQSSFSLSGILTFWFGSTVTSRPLLF